MFVKGQFFLIVVFVTLQSFGQTIKQDSLELPPPPPPRMSKSSIKEKIWQSDEYKIKLSVPSSWKTIIPNEGEIVSFISPNKENFAIRPYHLVFAGTADEIRERLETGYKSQFPKHKIISSKLSE